MRALLACALFASGSFCGAAAAQADVITDWNATAVVAVQALGPSTPVQSRALAIVHLAMFDALNAIDRRYASYGPPLQSPPGASPDAAFDDCRRALFHGSLLRRRLNTVLLWGRPNPKPDATLKDTTLTQLAPEVWTGLYAPLFMFDGTWTVEYHEGERLYRARLGARFRDALAPGQYPYPFWHNARKWADYEKADTVLFWINPASGSIVVSQFTNDGRENAGLKNLPVARPPFDGRWMWTDTDGTVQPQAALFQGLFAADNPYLAPLEPSYRDLANAMRKGHCNECHVPDNPNRTSRLVLLQTPAHAASEIKRLMNAVRKNDMPLDDALLPRGIDADTKAALLQYGAAFEAMVDAARAWERARSDSR